MSVDVDPFKITIMCNDFINSSDTVSEILLKETIKSLRKQLESSYSIILKLTKENIMLKSMEEVDKLPK